MITRDQILDALAEFANKRPGLKLADYSGDVAGYRRDMRELASDKRDAHRLIRAVRSHPSIGAKELREAFSAFSGRLVLAETSVCPECHKDPTLKHQHEPRPILDYTPGQHGGNTENRAAVCSVLAMAIRTWTRKNLPKDAPLKKQGELFRAAIVREFGAPFQRRWFN